jgi:hypothetical protein
MANRIPAPAPGTAAFNAAEDRFKKQFNSAFDRTKKQNDATLKLLEQQFEGAKLAFEAKQKQTLQGLSGDAKKAAELALEQEKKGLESRFETAKNELIAHHKTSESGLESAYKTAEERMKHGHLPTPEDLQRLGADAGIRSPYLNQLDPGNKLSGYDGRVNCGPAVMAMLARSNGYGMDLTDAQLVERFARIGQTGPEGTTGNGLIAIGEEIGLKARASEGADLRFIDAEIQQGRPVVALGDYWALPPHTDPARSFGHYVLITGRDALGNYRVHDPMEEKVTVITPDTLRQYMQAAPQGAFSISFQ